MAKKSEKGSRTRLPRVSSLVLETTNATDELGCVYPVTKFTSMPKEDERKVLSSKDFTIGAMVGNGLDKALKEVNPHELSALDIHDHIDAGLEFLTKVHDTVKGK